MARAAAAAAALHHELDALDGSGRRASASVDRTRNSTKAMASDVDKVSVVATKADRSINQLTGRIRLLTDVAAVLGPGLIPIGAIGIPAITGLAAGFGFAATAGATMIGAFQGVGDALKAVNKAALEPTEANLAAAKQAMEQISPAAQDFVRELRDMGPALKSLRDIGATEMFPGFTKGLDALETRLPDVQRIVGAVAGELGDIGEAVGESFASERWDDFFDFLATETPQALEDIAAATGNVTHAMAELWMAFDPLNDDFSNWLVDSTKGLDEWAMGLSQTQGFQEFIDYVRTTGPQVADTLGAVANALVQIVQAAAPLGGPVLQGLEALAKVIGSIADSDLGTPIFTALAGLALYNRTLGKTGALSQSAFGTKAKSGLKSYGNSLIGVVSAQERANTAAGKTAATASKQRAALAKGAAGMALLGAASTGVADKIGFANTAMLGMTGFLVGGAPGAVAGGAIGAVIDLTRAQEDLKSATDGARAAMGGSDIDAMTAAYKRLNAEIEKSKDRSLLDMLPDTGALGGVVAGLKTKAQGEATGAAAELKESINIAKNISDMQSMAAAGARFAQASAAGFRLTAAGAREAEGGIKALTAAFVAANAVINRQSAWDNYRMALLDAKDAVAETGKTLNKNGSIIRGQGRDMQRLGLTSRQTLRNIAAGAAETATKMKDFGRRTQFLQGARRDFIQLATGMGISRRAARGLADDLGLVSRINAKPKVEEVGAAESKRRIKAMREEIARLKPKTVRADEKGAAAARARVAALRAAIASLRDRTVTITTVRQNRGASGNVGAPGSAQAVAEGGTIDGPRQPYGDKVLAYLAPGEEVISNRFGQADRHRDLLKAINANAMANGGTVPGFARGGTAGADSIGVARNLNKLRDALRESVRELNKEKNLRASLTEKRKTLVGDVRGQFMSDPFEGGDVWSSGGGNPLGKLQADIAKAKAFKSTLYGLSKAGLKGDALASIAASGDLGQAQALLAGGTAGQYQTLFNQRGAAASAVASYAGMASYSGLQGEATREIRQLNREVRRLRAQIRGQHNNNRRDRRTNARETGREVAKGVNKGAAAARRRAR